MTTGRTSWRNLLAASLLTLALAGCGSSDITSYDEDTFFDQAMPKWLMPKLRDDYMGKKYFQPDNSPRAVERDGQGNPAPSPSPWSWWPWQ